MRTQQGGKSGGKSGFTNAVGRL